MTRASRRPPDRYDDATATLVQRPTRRAPLPAIVRVHGASAQPPVFRLEDGVCTVGSAPGCHVVINERSVSRNHVALELVPEGVALRDLGSRNGTYYLGQRVERMVLGVGGTVQVGAVATLTVEADQSALGSDEPFDGTEYRGAVGASPAMRRLFAVLARLEGSMVTVLLEGESGVGKEVVARAIHDGSRVAAGPYIAVNCGAIARELVASELFGHRRGAFTGAVDSRQGAFESANGGTVFLDEIGELPLEVQPMLLRVLETGEVRAVGEDRPRMCKVRVIAATNRDLGEEVSAGRFREDLFYRLAVVRLPIPPLRERIEDIAPLAEKFARDIGLSSLPPNVLEKLKSRAWAGNARELRNAVQAYAALGRVPEPTRGKDAMKSLVLAESVDLTRPFTEQRDEIVEEFTRLYLDALLAHTGGNQTVAARVAGLDRTYLGRLLSKMGKSGG